MGLFGRSSDHETDNDKNDDDQFHWSGWTCVSCGRVNNCSTGRNWPTCSKCGTTK